MKKHKQPGGVLGRNLAHAKKIKKFALAICLIAISLVSLTVYSADVNPFAGHYVEAAAAGILAVAPVFMVDGKFKELSAEAYKSFSEKATSEELAAYYREQLKAKNDELNSRIDAKASKEDIDSLKQEIAKMKEKQLEDLNNLLKKEVSETLKQHGIAIEKLTQGLGGKQQAGSDIRKHLSENLNKLKGLKESKDKANEVSFKAAGDMLISTNVSGGNVPVEQRLPGVNTIAERRIRLMDIVGRGTAQSNVISWVYEANQDGTVGGTAEGASKNQIDFDLVVASESVKKRTAYIKVSTEMLDDIDFIESLIRQKLFIRLLKDVENQVYQGNNVGTNLNGIRTVATAFSAGVFALTVDNANEADVLTVAANQIKIAEHEAPDYILMHPSDLTKLKLIKTSTTDRRYIDRLVMVAGNMSLDGIPIIETTLVTQGEYLIGNFGKAMVFSKGEVSIEIGLDGNDFTKNMRTILAEWRGLVIVENNDRTAFVKGTFATDKTALETP